MILLRHEGGEHVAKSKRKPSKEGKIKERLEMLALVVTVAQGIIAIIKSFQ